MGFEHCPVLGLHEPAVWHWSGSGQVTVLCAEQTPVLQTSTVQALLSVSQLVPFDFIGYVHCPVAPLHVPAMWH
jgi:hypothetical protein